MKHTRLAIFGLVATLVATTAFSSSASAQTAGSHIAVVNLQKVYGTLTETADWQRRLQGMQQALELKQKADQADLQQLQSQIGTLQVKPDSDAYKAAIANLDDKSLQDSLDEQTMKVKMAREANRQLKKTFDEMEATIADIAKKNGYDIVLVASDPELPNNVQDTTDFEHLAQAIFSRNVAYVSEKADITADVITSLDAAYKAHK
jgi:Skp family chaperone for outer membrane proteins